MINSTLIQKIKTLLTLQVIPWFSNMILNWGNFMEWMLKDWKRFALILDIMVALALAIGTGFVPGTNRLGPAFMMFFVMLALGGFLIFTAFLIQNAIDTAAKKVKPWSFLLITFAGLTALPGSEWVAKQIVALEIRDTNITKLASMPGFLYISTFGSILLSFWLIGWVYRNRNNIVTFITGVPKSILEAILGLIWKVIKFIFGLFLRFFTLIWWLITVFPKTVDKHESKILSVFAWVAVILGIIIGVIVVFAIVAFVIFLLVSGLIAIL